MKATITQMMQQLSLLAPVKLTVMDNFATLECGLFLKASRCKEEGWLVQLIVDVSNMINARRCRGTLCKNKAQWEGIINARGHEIKSDLCQSCLNRKWSVAYLDLNNQLVTEEREIDSFTPISQ